MQTLVEQVAAQFRIGTGLSRTLQHLLCLENHHILCTAETATSSSKCIRHGLDVGALGDVAVNNALHKLLGNVMSLAGAKEFLKGEAEELCLRFSWQSRHNLINPLIK